ncbi:MAG TPA: VCBS repeat-containing protein, partial [Opitutaceae bacterium]
LLASAPACLLRAQFLNVGSSPQALGTNRENFETPAYRVGAFGWAALTMTEQHGEFRYPTPADLNPAGWFSSLPHDFARGDFDGDGREDLVMTVATFPHTVPRQTRFTFAVLLNDGQGGFRYSTDIWAAGGAPTRSHIVTRVIAADFNRDGRADFVGAPEGLNQRNADGTFTTVREPIPLALSGPDGKLHDATANIAGQESGGRVPGLDFSHDLAVGDINGDGAPDIYTAGALLLNDGAGRFAASAQVPAELKPGAHYIMSSAIGDLDGDGIGDLVVAYSDGAANNASGWLWLSQNGSPALTGRRLVALPAGRYGAGQTKLNHVALFDATGDGLTDIVFGITRAIPYYRGRTLQILVNQGNGAFVDETAARVVAPADLDTAWGQGQLQVADVNRDGIPDVVHSGGAVNDETAPPAMTVYLGGRDGILRALDRAALPWVQPWQLAGFEGTRATVRRAQSITVLADIDGRSHLDFVSMVATPFTRWPQVEPSQVSFYSVVARAAEVARPISTLSNLSVRTGAGAGDRTLIVGFVVADGARDVLMRAVGPTLAAFGLGGTLGDPKLELYAGTVRSATNDNWAASGLRAADFAAVGAFALPAGSRDSALRASLSGARSIRVTGADDGSGIALVELYDTGGGTGRLINVSARAAVGTGADILAAGFAVSGGAPKRLLLRAAGPTLTAFGVGDALADPVLTLRRLGEDTPLATNDDWAGTAALTTAFASVGAFQFSPATSSDAALIVELPPGTYTATVSGKNDTTGVALVEVYELP